MANGGARGVGYITELYVGRTRVGVSRPSSVDGSFSFELRNLPKRSKAPLVHVRIVDEKGTLILKTAPVRLSGGIPDFQVQLGGPRRGRHEPDIYSNNLKRLLKAYRRLEGRLDPSNEGALDGLKGLIRLIGGWEGDRICLEKAGADEVVQVPRRPTIAAHQHVSAWDQVVLPE
jgi:hypothetical protein